MKCWSPWANLNINPDGSMAPCCRFRHDLYEDQFDFHTDSIQDYLNSPFLDEIKDQMINDKWPKGCLHCQNDEENNIVSKRQLDLELHPVLRTYEPDQGFVLAAITFGNICNLKCITCTPKASSRWRQEYNTIYGKDMKVARFYEQGLVDQIVSQNVTHIDIAGGEPFLREIPQHEELIQKLVQTGQAPNISLHYTTNVQAMPSEQIWNLWNEFKEIEIQMSIDGLRDRFEYIRYPAKWPTMTNNAAIYWYENQQRKNMKLSISHTVSAFNVMYLDEFWQWCKQAHLPEPYLGNVTSPAHWRANVWIGEHRKRIQETLQNSTVSEIRRFAKMFDGPGDEQLYNTFLKTLKAHDQYRGLNFEEVFFTI